MERTDLNRRCADLLCHHPDVKLRMWHPRMFWQTGSDTPRVDEIMVPRVDLCELEVMLATAAMVDSQCLQELKARDPDRADYIVHPVRRGERPLLRRPQS